MGDTKLFFDLKGVGTAAACSKINPGVITPLLIFKSPGVPKVPWGMVAYSGRWQALDHSEHRRSLASLKEAGHQGHQRGNDQQDVPMGRDFASATQCSCQQDAECAAGKRTFHWRTRALSSCSMYREARHRDQLGSSDRPTDCADRCPGRGRQTSSRFTRPSTMPSPGSPTCFPMGG